MRSRRVASRARRGPTKWAQIIGVTESDTTVETAMAKTSVTENSRSRRPDDAVHEQQRDERRDQRHADGDDGEADLPRADERGLHRPHAALDVAVDVLDHDDGVVDDEADDDGERHQREIVDREAERPHGRAGAGERQRHGDAGREGRRRPPQEDEDHQHDQQRSTAAA